jgi:hypothetical protein
MPKCANETKKVAGYTRHLWGKYWHFGRQGNWEGGFVFVDIPGLDDPGKCRVGGTLYFWGHCGDYGGEDGGYGPKGGELPSYTGSKWGFDVYVSFVIHIL